jgi:beta-ureidopropionase / N-carbamoyl-L-amino-acid hydrolase
MSETNLRVNGRRLMDAILEMARIGATPKGGCNRQTLTDLDREGRDLLKRWCVEAGLTVTVDEMGNMFARRPGRRDDLPPVALGSHLDTQPTGGKYDGVLGVLAGLEVVRTLNDAGLQTERPIVVVNWTNEEGTRFAPAMLSSGVFGGAFTRDYAYARTDREGRTFGEELARIGYKGDLPCRAQDWRCHLELHIEQGPILEAESKAIGVVTDGQGIRWLDVAITGRESHAGPTPMPRRKDALVAAAKVIARLDEIARAHGPDGVATVGVIDAYPASRNIIPGRVDFTVDMRHPDAGHLEAMANELRAAIADACARDSLEHVCDEIWYFPPVEFDRTCVETVRAAAEALGYGHRDMVSGAGHDAFYTARAVPTSMIFIPCRDGLSHNEEEHAEPEHIEAGANVLLGACLRMARGG